MLYNWELNFKEMEKKRKKCWEWKVQIADCRFRPLDQLYDNYHPTKTQTSDDYYIHPKWTDKIAKESRRNVRRQNICVRMGFEEYNRELERRGSQDRRIRRKIIKQLKKSGYNAPKVRQITKEERGWTANVKIAEKHFDVKLSSDYQMKDILERS
jgi:hypothetical protein